MNILDIILAIPLAWAAWRGFKKGLIIEVASLVALGLGIYGAVNHSNLTAGLVQDNLDVDREYLPLIAFVLTFIAIVALVYVLAKILERVVNLVALKLVNKLAGSLFGILKVGLILSMVLLIVDLFDQKVQLIKPEHRNASILYSPVAAMAPLIIPGISGSDWHNAIESQLQKAEDLIPVINQPEEEAPANED